MCIVDAEHAVQHIKDRVDEWGDPNSWAEMPTRYVLIDPMMKALGWDYSDPYHCNFEHPRTPKGARMKKIDYVFFHPNQREYVRPNYPNRPVILLEAKALFEDLSKPGHIRQLRDYANVAPRVESGYAVLTNGRYWKLYNLAERGRFASKLEHDLDLVAGSRRNLAEVLHEALGRQNWWS